jgi:cytochrome c biogenesis protein CcmG/thiol:disulfide interchange protein DsbE
MLTNAIAHKGGHTSMKGKILSWAAVAAALAVVYVFAMPSYRQGEPSVAGRRAPDFALEMNGRAVQLADLQGKVVVLVFWASWCAPCVEETPALNALERRIEANGGVVLGVSEDDDPAAYSKFLTEQRVVFPTYRDPTKKIASTYGTAAFPEAYIISRDGKIARKIVGPQDWTSPELTSTIDTLLHMS